MISQPKSKKTSLTNNKGISCWWLFRRYQVCLPNQYLLGGKSLKYEEGGHLIHMHISYTLSMVGVELKASWQASRKVNNDFTVDKIQKCINSWRAGKFMPLVCRPFSINTYCLSKVWFRSASVDLRVSDITEISKKIKSYCYQDLYHKSHYRDMLKKGGWDYIM